MEEEDECLASCHSVHSGVLISLTKYPWHKESVNVSCRTTVGGDEFTAVLGVKEGHTAYQYLNQGEALHLSLLQLHVESVPVEVIRSGGSYDV